MDAIQPPNQGLLPEGGIEEKEEKVPDPLEKPIVTGHVGFVEAQFSVGEGVPSLGLVLDWTMPFPVIARVLPGTAAARRKQLYAGLVLVAINKSGLRIRPVRDLVEEKLQARPLQLVLEAPAPERFDFFSTAKRWKRHLIKARREPKHMQALGNAQALMLGQSSSRLLRTESGDFEAPPLPSPPPASNLAQSLTRVKTCPGSLASIDDMHGTRVPDLRDMRDTVKLPPVIRQSTALELPMVWNSDPRQRQRQAKPGMALTHGPSASSSSWGAAASMAAQPLRQAVSTKSLTWLASSMPKPDTAYQHLIDDPRPVGPGCPERWPLHHDEMYICRLSDMQLAWRLREAYEVGFRGQKTERPTQMHLTCSAARGPGGIPELQTKIDRVEEVYCDLCGADVELDPEELNMQGSAHQELPGMLAGFAAAGEIAAAPKPKAKPKVDDGPPLEGNVKESNGAFYFCRRCKRSGKRFELCAACHAIEVIQCEGKHYGRELHPHFLRCSHSALVPKKFVNEVIPGMVHIRRVMCDYCGHLAASHASDGEVWICQQCPEIHGLRFELCTPCYNSLDTVSGGLGRLREQMSLM